MATYKEICESVLEEANGRPVTLASVDLGVDASGNYYVTDPTQRNILRWVNEIYLLIQQKCLHWDFMHKRGLFLTTRANAEVYTKAAVREIKADSMYAVLSGSTGRTPVCLSDYDSWVEHERRGEVAGGAPLEIIQRPDKKWIIDPTPTQVWNIYADWWVLPAKFTEGCEEPLWEAEFHDLLKWKTLLLFSDEFGEEGAGSILKSRISRMLPMVETGFNRRYQPSIRGAEALV